MLHNPTSIVSRHGIVSRPDTRRQYVPGALLVARWEWGGVEDAHRERRWRSNSVLPLLGGRHTTLVLSGAL